MKDDNHTDEEHPALASREREWKPISDSLTRDWEIFKALETMASSCQPLVNGFLRLWRVEPEKPIFERREEYPTQEQIDKLAKLGINMPPYEETALFLSVGRWFSDDWEDSRFYAMRDWFKNPVLVYVDLRADLAEQYRVSNSPAQYRVDDPQQYSRNPEHEFFVTTEIAAQKTFIGPINLYVPQPAPPSADNKLSHIIGKKGVGLE